ncbi:MAG: hypothetical protein ACRC37_04525, partial [Lentisphaeria bacterium]
MLLFFKNFFVFLILAGKLLVASEFSGSYYDINWQVTLADEKLTSNQSTELSDTVIVDYNQQVEFLPLKMGNVFEVETTADYEKPIIFDSNGKKNVKLVTKIYPRIGGNIKIPARYVVVSELNGSSKKIKLP